MSIHTSTNTLSLWILWLLNINTSDVFQFNFSYYVFFSSWLIHLITHFKKMQDEIIV